MSIRFANRRPRRRLWHLTALASLLVVLGCSGSSPEPEDKNGLRPGRYSVIYEIFPSIGIPDNTLGTHRLTFRVNEPGLSAEDFEILSASRTPDSGPRETDHLVVDPERLEISVDRWVIRFPSSDGSYYLGFSIGNAGFGDFQVLSGCRLNVEGGTNLLAAGCVIERG